MSRKIFSALKFRSIGLDYLVHADDDGVTSRLGTSRKSAEPIPNFEPDSKEKI
jgi:hypothetical protein